MVGIYEYANGLVFTGIIAETEQKAWEYLDNKVNEEFGGKLGFNPMKANRSAFAIKEVTVI